MNWRDVTEWCHQGDEDQFGLCFFAMCGNRVVLEGRGVMPVGEIEAAARAMNGFDPYIKATDKGENLEAGFRFIQERGWPNDPTLRIASWAQVDLPLIGGVIARRKGVECWLELPMTEDGLSYAFEDEALFRGARGVYAHAVEVVEDTGRDLTLITWGGPKTVSHSWAQAYFRGCYETVWTDIT